MRAGWVCWMVMAVGTSAVATAGQPLQVPAGEEVYATPMATIDGRGAVPFHITLGMLVTAGHTPVGLYRSYPSKSAVPLIEQYGLGMLGTRDGVILASIGDLPLLVLHGHIDMQPGTYVLTVEYLSQLAPRAYGRCTLRIARTAHGRWETVDRAGQPVTEFKVVSSRAGISSIEPCGS